MRLLILNGWAASSVMLEDFKSYLLPSYDVQVLDGLYQFELAEVVAKIDALMTAKTVLIGWSLGGMLALYYARFAKANHKPASIILLNSSACFVEKLGFPEGVARDDFNALNAVVEAHDAKALLRLFSHLLVQGSERHKEDRRVLQSVFNAQTLPGWTALESGMKYLDALDLRNSLASIRLPVLAIFGENDALIDSNFSLKLLETNALVKCKVISGMGHFPFGVFAQDMATLIVDNLNSLSESQC